jgi:hypothetical protein
MNTEEPLVTRKEFEDFKCQVLSGLETLTTMINADRLSSTRRAKVAQDILSYQLEAIKEHLPSLDNEALKKKSEERLQKFKDECKTR